MAACAAAAPPDSKTIGQAAALLRTARNPAVLLGGGACSEPALQAAARLAASGLRIITDTFVARQSRGAGRFAPERLKYFAEMAVSDLQDVDCLLTVDTSWPVAFFAYPDKPGVLAPAGCRTFALATPSQDGAVALAMLADELRAPACGPTTQYVPVPAFAGVLSPKAIGVALAHHQSKLNLSFSLPFSTPHVRNC